MQKLRWCAVLVLFSLSLPAFSQGARSKDEVELYGSVKGTLSKSGCAIDLNTINPTGMTQHALCDTDGNFQFTNLARGAYTLVVRVGMDQYSQEVRLASPREEIEIHLPVQPRSSSSVISLSELQIPTQAMTELEKANQAMAKGDLNKADELATQALNLAPRFARALTLRAVLMIARQDFASALKVVNDATTIDPSLAIAQFVRASVLNDTGRPQDAQQAAERGLRLEGRSWQGHLELARALIAQQEFKQALLEINQAALNAPQQFADLLLMRASVLFQLQDVNGARENLNEFTRLRPGDARAERLHSLLEAQTANR